MRYYRLFRKYQGGIGWVEQDPVSISAQSKTTGDVVVEILTPTKLTTYYANGHYYVALDITKYTLDTDYKLIWTFEMVLGNTQTIEAYFKLSIVGEETVLVGRPVGGNLNKALQRFGDTLLVVEDSGYTAILGNIWGNKSVSNYWLRQYVPNVMFVNTPEVFGGTVVRDVIRSKYYFIYNLGKVLVGEDVMEQKGTLLHITKECEIQRLTGAAGGMGGTSQSFASQETEIRCHLREIGATLRAERPALLESASFLLYMQSSEDLQLLDRVIIDSVNYQVEHIDTTTFIGMHETQLALDKR